MAAMMVFGLAACGSKEITNDGNGADAGQAAAGASVSAPASGAGGYIFETNGVKVEIDSKMADIEAALGEPKSYFEAASCAFGDMDKVYTYSGFRIDTYQIDGQDYVSDVIFMDDTVSTPEGVSIGDSADKVKEVYGTPTAEDDKRLVYENGSMKLVFLLDNGTVNTIEYLTRILEE